MLEESFFSNNGLESVSYGVGLEHYVDTSSVKVDVTQSKQKWLKFQLVKETKHLENVIKLDNQKGWETSSETFTVRLGKLQRKITQQPWKSFRNSCTSSNCSSNEKSEACSWFYNFCSKNYKLNDDATSFVKMKETL